MKKNIIIIKIKMKNFFKGIKNRFHYRKIYLSFKYIIIQLISFKIK